MLRQSVIALALAGAFAAPASMAAQVQLITNGGFETGTLAGWTATDAGSGAVGIDDNNGTTPISGSATVGPNTGSFYAVTDQSGPGTHALEQSFTVPAGAISVIVSFAMFMNDFSNVGPIVDPAGLDHTQGPNQHARVDIMTALAGAFSTAPVDIVTTLVAPSVDPGADPNPYTLYSFDITAFVTPGGTYKLRFGETDNQFFFNQGIDDVSIVAKLPVPAPLALLGVALTALGLSRRRSA